MTPLDGHDTKFNKKCEDMHKEIPQQLESNGLILDWP